jgi:hypothetical protein
MFGPLGSSRGRLRSIFELPFWSCSGGNTCFVGDIAVYCKLTMYGYVPMHLNFSTTTYDNLGEKGLVELLVVLQEWFRRM